MKKGMLILKVAFAFLFAFLVSFNLVVDQAMATGQFTKTCEEINISGSTLSATCQKADGYTLNDSSLNLDQYIGNLDGTLSWGDKDFSKTCENIALAQLLFNKQLVVTAQCEKKDGISYEQSDIELDAHIANIDGTLKYE